MPPGRDGGVVEIEPLAARIRHLRQMMAVVRGPDGREHGKHSAAGNKRVKHLFKGLGKFLDMFKAGNGKNKVKPFGAPDVTRK